MTDLYDTDITLWSEQQARLLRRHAAGKPVNNDDLDWQNIAEEIESLAKSDRREIRNRLAVICTHLLKWHVQPEGRAAAGAAPAAPFRAIRSLAGTRWLRRGTRPVLRSACPHLGCAAPAERGYRPRHAVAERPVTGPPSSRGRTAT